jgi:hypothetical protein
MNFQEIRVDVDHSSSFMPRRFKATAMFASFIVVCFAMNINTKLSCTEIRGAAKLIRIYLWKYIIVQVYLIHYEKK